jgi:hypothetical protein
MRRVAALVAAGLALTACGSAARAEPASAPVASQRPNYVALAGGVSCPARIETRDHAKLKRFHAVAAYRCAEGQRVYPKLGRWLVWNRYVLTGHVGSLQRWYELPNQRHSHGACLLNLVVVPTTVFVDGHGNELVPPWPVDGCGHPRAGQPDHGVSDWRVVATHRVRRLVSAAALAAGCAMQIKNLAEGAAGTLEPLPAGPMFPRAPRVVRVCVYRTPAHDLEVGSFVRGFRLDPANTRRLLDLLTGAGPSGCAAQRRFATISSLRGWGEVELGGCWRVSHYQGPFGLGRATNPAAVRSMIDRG